MPIIKLKLSKCVLSSERTPHVEIKLVMIKELVDLWAKNFVKNIFPYKPSGIPNHNHDKLNSLEHDDFKKEIIEPDIRVTPIYVGFRKHWINITMAIKYKITLKVKIKIFQPHMNRARKERSSQWKSPRLDILVRRYFPIFESGEVNIHLRPASRVSDKVNFDILNI